MAASPQFKVYNARKEYIAACKHAEDAAILVGMHGEGATVRWQHSIIVWTEGNEEQSAAESFDAAAQVIYDRCDAHSEKMFSKYKKGAN